MSRPGRLLAAWLLLAAAPAWAGGAAKGGARDAPAPDPLFSVTPPGDDWVVTRQPFGCFLVAPHGAGAHTIALGVHQDYGRGLALVGYPLSITPAQGGEPVTVFAGGRELARSGRTVAPGVLFIDLSPDEVNQVLREIWYAEVIWVAVRGTSVALGGGGAKQAVANYGAQCAPR